MKITSISLLLFVIVSSCNQEVINGEGKNVESDKVYEPFVLDTLGLELSPFITFGKERIHSSYLYFGPKKDTIVIGGEYKGMKLSPCDIVAIKTEELNPAGGGFYSLDCDYWNPYKKWVSPDVLKITVDTTVRVSKPLSHYSEEFCKGYLVLVEGVSDYDSIDIGYGFYLPIEIQAKDSVGNWLNIEDKLQYGCGTSLSNVIMPPSYIAVSAVYIYDGDYPTELRLKFGGNFSNTFFGKINYSQFENNGKSYFYSPPPPPPLDSK